MRDPQRPQAAARLPSSAIRGFGSDLDHELRRAARREQRFLALLDLGREVARIHDARDVCATGLLTLMGYVGTARSAIWIADETLPGRVRVADEHGLPAGLAEAVAEGLAALCGPASDPTEPEVTRLEFARLDDVTRARLAAGGIVLVGNLRARGEVLGVLALGSRVGAEPLEDIDLEILSAACGMIAIALENARLVRHLRSRSQDLSAANERLRELDRMKSEFLANVNHELRTPLAVIIGSIGCLRMTGFKPHEVERFITMIHLQAGKLTEMIQRLLDFTSLTNSRVEIRLDPLDLAAIAALYHRSRAPKVQDGGRRCELDAPEPVPVIGDAKRVADALDRLVDNAQRFTPEGTTIRIEARTEDRGGAGWGVLTVRDDGPGIAPEHLARVLAPFEQADGSATRAVGGLGLGLATARAGVEAMQGRLEAESAPGRGATFRIVLPIAHDV